MKTGALCRAVSAVFLLAAPLLAAQPETRGVVRDSLNKPLAEAHVELLPVQPLYEQGLLRLEGRESVAVSAATTDALGRFLLTASRPGLFTVRIAAPGKVPLTFGPFPLLEAMELPPVVLPEDAGARVVVRTAEGRLAAGLRVLVGSDGADAAIGGGWRIESRTGLTATDGSNSLPRLAGELLHVRVLSGQGLEDVREKFEGGEVRLGAAAPIERRLRVVDARGEAVGGVLVSLGEPAWPVGLTAADGRLSLRLRNGDPVLVRLSSRDGRQASEHLAAPSPGGSRPQEETLVLDDGFPAGGRVVTDKGGRPLPGALVWCGADPGAFLLTDADGRYQTHLMAEGVTWLQAQAPGLLAKRILPSASQVRAGRIPTFALTRAGALTGRVTDDAGAALFGVWVRAVPVVRGPAPSAQSTASTRRPALGGGGLSAIDGTFRLSLLNPGELYELHASKPGFLPTTTQALAPPAGHGAGGPVVLSLAPARAAAGRVEDVDHRPIAGAALRLTETAGRAGSRERTAAAVSDPRGRFNVAEIPALALDLEVSKPGYSPAVVRNFKVRPGTGTVDLGTITLRAGAVISGMVSDPRGRPVAGARVFRVDNLQLPFALADRLRDEAPDGTTGADGRFSLADLPQGVPVHLLITAPGHLPATVRGVRPPTAKPLRIRLESGSAFAGRVLDAGRLPVSGADVELAWRPTLPGRADLPTGPPMLKSTRTGRDGRFAFQELPAGAATLSVAATGFVAAEEVPVPLPQAPGEETTIVLEHGTTLEGRVATTKGEPVPGARVLAGSAVGLSDSEGIFSLDAVPTGPVRVEVRHPQYKPFQRNVQIEEGVNHLDVTFEAGREVRGQVVDPSGAPVAGAAVTLEGATHQDAGFYSGRSDMDGAFVLSRVAAGRYRLQASAQGFADTELPRAVVVEREPISGIEVVLTPGGTITGRLLGLKADELPRVTVRARHESGVSEDAEVDADGHYTLQNLRAGSWLLQASLGAGQRQVQARVLLPAGGEETRDLRFGGHLALSGLVLYRDQPLADAQISLRGEHLAVERSMRTDHDGLFRFEELDADTYQLGLTHTGELLTHNQTVELTGDRTVTIRLERSIVSGRVMDAAQSEPLANARVDLRHLADEDGPEFLMGGSSDETGTFRLERVPPGRYHMIVSHEGYSPAERNLEVVAGVDLPNLEVPLQSTPGAELTVRLASGRIPSLLHVRLQSPDGVPVLAESRPVGRDGTVRITTAPPGSWVLLAASPEGALATIPLPVPGKRTDLILPDASRLAVRIPSLASSDALATLRITATNGQPLQILGPGGNFTQQWQLIAGNAAIEGVPAGVWIVSATSPDGRNWTTDVVTDGRSDLQVSLE